MAVERLKACDNIVALSEELGVHRRLLHKWRDQLDPGDVGDEAPPENSREYTLRKEIKQLKRVLVDKTLELDFFKGALQKVEARRQKTEFGLRLSPRSRMPQSPTPPSCARPRAEFPSPTNLPCPSLRNLLQQHGANLS